MNALLDRAREEAEPENVPVCRGTLLSREQYLVDLRERGYADARLAPHGNVSPEALQIWTNAIAQRK
jgi:hypothetical protein